MIDLMAIARTENEARRVLELNPTFEKAHVAIAISQLATASAEHERYTYFESLFADQKHGPGRIGHFGEF